LKPLRILLVDDHPLYRKGVRDALASRPEMIVVGEAEDGNEAIALARTAAPDIILMDISMPNCEGLEALRAIKRERPQTQVIMLTVAEDNASLFEAIRSGAAGYLLKNVRAGDLLQMLDAVRRGEPAMPGRLAARILQEFRQPREAKADATDPLTSREKTVLEHVALGESNREIAEALCITEHTVKVHLRTILEKLHLQNRIQAAVYAVRQGLVGDHPEQDGRECPHDRRSLTGDDHDR